MKRNNVLELPPLYIIKLILIASVICYFISCAPSKEQQHKNNIAAATKYTAKALKKDTTTVLTTVRLLAPCVTTDVKVDSVEYIRWRDSLVYVPTISYKLQHDTIIRIEDCNQIIKDLQNAVSIRDKKLSYIANNPPPPIIKEKAVKDSADIIAANIVIREQLVKITEQEKELATKKAAVTIFATASGILFFGIIFLTLALIKNKK
jgi:hypothetical protein